MKRICVVIQSDAFRSSAGVRIRYERFIEGCIRTGVEITITPIQKLIGAALDHDAYVFCKTFSVEAIILAFRAKQRGCIVAQDLFDDYFSQSADQRLFQYRTWLRMMSPVTDVALCTTPRMREVIAPFMDGKPVILIEDPIDGYDPLRIAALVERKTADSHTTRRLNVTWFGIGDNPFFPVGIADLTCAAVNTQLSTLSGDGWEARLVVATNVRALGPDGLAALRTISVPVELVEWTEQVERQALIDADIAILPVSGQNFSRAKSMNRAITALGHGCQILSLGEHLYDELAPFVYHSAEDILADLAAGTPRLAAANVPHLTDLLNLRANAYTAGAAFASAILEASAYPSPSAMAVLHGWQTHIAVHKLSSEWPAISVKTPFCPATWNFGVRFELRAAKMIVLVVSELAARYGIPTFPDQIEIGHFKFREVVPDAYPPLPSFPGGVPEAPNMLAGYVEAITAIGDVLRRLIPGIHVCLNDTSPWNIAPLGLNR